MSRRFARVDRGSEHNPHGHRPPRHDGGPWFGVSSLVSEPELALESDAAELLTSDQDGVIFQTKQVPDFAGPLRP